MSGKRMEQLLIPKEKLIEMYRKMLEIRLFEEKVAEVFAKGQIPGFLHLCIGQEAVAVGVCMNLRKDDYITFSHRGHGHCLAKGTSMRKVMAELFGKSSGCCKGRGGSMHLTDIENGVLGANAIVGANIPIAAGAALSVKLKGTDQVVVCFFGDGAANTGAFHEGLNIAALWKLPVVYVCENNLYAISTHVSTSTSVKDIAIRATAYGIPGEIVDGMDVIAVYETSKKAIERARKGEGPSLLECKTYRFCGSFQGDPQEYRTKEERLEWEKRCPIKTLKEKLVKLGILTEELDKKIHEEIKTNIEDSVKFAQESPYPSEDEVGLFIFA
jgi:pyruvate dehydrogenase E1 component alpha subunit